jgi:hypothetical protein
MFVHDIFFKHISGDTVTFNMSCQGSYFQPTNQRGAYYTKRAVDRLLNIARSLAYGWTVKDERKVT